MLFTIGNSVEALVPGNFPATFVGMSPLETANGKAYRWEFKGENGKTISGLSDAEKPPTTKNKTGRWLCALAAKPILAGTQVDPETFIGKKYLLIVVAAENGGKLETFTAI